MASWFRSWHGAPTDPKWRVIARLANVDLSVVIACAWALLDHASQCPDRGFVGNADAEVLAESIGSSPECVTRVVEALHVKNILRESRFAAWDERQPKREDDSSDRVAKHRERKRNEVQRTVTPSNAPDTEAEQKRTEKKKAASVKVLLAQAFEEFWPYYPKKADKTRALEVWCRDVKPEDVPQVIEAAKRYALVVAGHDPQYTKHAATWLAKGRWRDSLTAEIPTRVAAKNESLFANSEPEPEPETPKKEVYGWTAAILRDNPLCDRESVRKLLLGRANGRTEYVTIINGLYPDPITPEGELNA